MSVSKARYGPCVEEDQHGVSLGLVPWTAQRAKENSGKQGWRYLHMLTQRKEC